MVFYEKRSYSDIIEFYNYKKDDYKICEPTEDIKNTQCNLCEYESRNDFKLIAHNYSKLVDCKLKEKYICKSIFYCFLSIIYH